MNNRFFSVFLLALLSLVVALLSSTLLLGSILHGFSIGAAEVTSTVSVVVTAGIFAVAYRQLKGFLDAEQEKSELTRAQLDAFIASERTERENTKVQELIEIAAGVCLAMRAVNGSIRESTVTQSISELVRTGGSRESQNRMRAAADIRGWVLGSGPLRDRFSRTLDDLGDAAWIADFYGSDRLRIVVARIHSAGMTYFGAIRAMEEAVQRGAFVEELGPSVRRIFGDMGREPVPTVPLRESVLFQMDLNIEYLATEMPDALYAELRESSDQYFNRS